MYKRQANVPFGLVQVGPTSIPQAWDWTSGYHASDSTVIGFSHTHLSGTGIGDLFDITVMPVTGEVTYARGTANAPQSGLWSYADRTRELARHLGPDRPVRPWQRALAPRALPLHHDYGNAAEWFLFRTGSSGFKNFVRSFSG